MPLERLDIQCCEDKFQVALHRARYDFALGYLRPDDAALEIGTGLGVFAEELCHKCRAYTGVEYDEAACQAARERTHANIIQADARNLPFAENQFSYIVCLEVLEHLGDWQAGVRQIHRCLQPQGRVVISVPWRRRGGKNNINKFHLYEPGEHELVSMFRGLFGKVEIFYQYFPETSLMTLARNLHLRQLLGLVRPYAELTQGLPAATDLLRIDPLGKGMRIVLMFVAAGKK